MSNTSLLDTSLVYGKCSAKIESFKEIPAITDDNNQVIRDAYIKVILRLSNNETLIADEQLFETRWYAKRITYIMRCLNRQFNNVAYTLRDLIDYARTHSFIINISVDPKYGYQVEYEP